MRITPPCQQLVIHGVNVIIVDHDTPDLKEKDLTPLLWPDASDLRVIYVTLSGDKMTVHERHQVTGAGEAAQSLRAALQTAGISPAAIERFFRPFFGGVLLDNALESSAALLRFYTRRFVFGRAFVPSRGMRAFAAYLAAQLPQCCLHLNCPVESIECDSNRVRAVVVGGRRVEVESVILAMDAWSSSRLLNLPLPPSRPPVWTVFFSARESLYRGRLIVLPAGRRRLVRHFVQMTNIAREYAPSGSHLVVATVLDPRDLHPPSMAKAAEAEIREVFPHAQLEVVDILRVPNPVAPQLPGFMKNQAFFPQFANMQIAGDFQSWGSTEGAVLSGLHAAQTILNSRFL